MAMCIFGADPSNAMMLSGHLIFLERSERMTVLSNHYSAYMDCGLRIRVRPQKVRSKEVSDEVRCAAAEKREKRAARNLGGLK